MPVYVSNKTNYNNKKKVLENNNNNKKKPVSCHTYSILFATINNELICKQQCTGKVIDVYELNHISKWQESVKCY